MSFITKNRIKNWLLIFLLVTNTATISTILYHRWSFRNHIMERNPHQKMKEFIKNDLGLSDEQKTTFEKERIATDSIRETLYYKMENFRISIYSQFATPLPDSAVVFTAADSMSKLFSEINSTGISHNIFMLNHCTPEQKTKLLTKYEEMVNEMKKEQQEMCSKDENERK